MKSLKGRVAVVTGAASGIGLGLAERFAAEGMKVVLADVEVDALGRAERSLRSAGAEVLAVPTDVSKADQVDRLALEARTAFGGVHVVCNNAGVGPTSGAAFWEMSHADWEWVLGVNLWGVINGMRAFTPILLEQEEGHIVNTASMAGLNTSAPGSMGVYSVTKHAVVALSESLHVSLQIRGANVGVSVLCPAWVRTNISDSVRNRPADYPSTERERTPQATAAIEYIRGLVAAGTQPADIAATVVDAIYEQRFYVIPHPEALPVVRQRMDDILQGRSPVLGPPWAPLRTESPKRVIESETAAATTKGAGRS
jgi:NAD(P)-dependent dehydrogenase (short-subunit alcohol dehydrogenase family)